jgi:hypothetical protein
MDGQAKKSKVELTWCAPHTLPVHRSPNVKPVKA